MLQNHAFFITRVASVTSNFTKGVPASKKLGTYVVKLNHLWTTSKW